MRRKLANVLMTAGSALALVALLVMLDDRVREQISMRLSSEPRVEIAQAGHQVQNLARVVIVAAHEQTIEHAPLVIFALAGSVLMVFMLRT